ncbi:MAG: peptidoglycan bridge formation glycyltransferase FemA/FemB family protein [Patescibacteria group bacterium]|nr:peptidoglycan bridge formation glycyltransferase FemA/FemB family protein [Patescibacteria group bacterium]
MQIKLEQIQDSYLWNNFIVHNFSFYSFLQSWEWGELHELENHKVWRIGIYKTEESSNHKAELIGVMQIIKIAARRGTHLFCPHGPLIKSDYFEVLQEILPELKKLAKKENANFIRFNPINKATLENQAAYKMLGFRQAPIHIHAETTWIVDLKDSEEILMQNLRKTTRYLIRRAEKEGVKIKTDNSKSAVDLFYKLHKKHSSRENGHKYTAFSKTFIDRLFQVFANNKQPATSNQTLISAWYKNECEASLSTIKFGNFCVYYLGASDVKHPQFSPSYLLQWHAILEAKKSGCEFYNFWGVSPNNDPKHPIYGVSQFKKGFGGFGYELLHAQDLILSWKYWLNWVVETVRRYKRGYFYPKPISKQEFDKQGLPF